MIDTSSSRFHAIVAGVAVAITCTLGFANHRQSSQVITIPHLTLAPAVIPETNSAGIAIRGEQVAASNGIYRGAWFQVWSPPNFKAIPSLKSSSATDGYDSVFFRSPDGRVEFYVYAPQWSGEPIDIALDAARERQITSETKTSNARVVTWLTIQAVDGSYVRTYQDTRARDGSTRCVIGLKYSNQSAYDAYRADYVRFKESVSQFAD